MQKPDWCPQDIWDEAWGAEAWARSLYAAEVTDNEKLEVVTAIATALLAEREAVDGRWSEAAIELMCHLEDVLPDDIWNDIDTDIWNAVSEMATPHA